MTNNASSVTSGSVPPYSYLRNQVSATRTQSLNSNKSWMESSQLRLKIFDQAKSSIYGPEKQMNEAIISIWRGCYLTAPMALTLITPDEKSYAHLTDSILFMSMLYDPEKVNLQASVQSGLEAFEKCLRKSLKTQEEGFSLLCNLYQGTHVFVVEKRSEETCVLYQSYLNTSSDSYTFDQFVSDESKHVQWNINEFANSIGKIISKDLPIDERNEQYNKLFYNTLSKDSFELKDKIHPYPLVFLSTESYILKKD